MLGDPARMPVEISIHAPRAGSDVRAPVITPPVFDFNPRSPCGERLQSSLSIFLMQLFQSTLPVRGATRASQLKAAYFQFQSTLPVRGATLVRRSICANASHFNPRSPCGERPKPRSEPEYMQVISIHAPRAGSDGTCFQLRVWERLFQSTLPVRGATQRDRECLDRR